MKKINVMQSICHHIRYGADQSAFYTLIFLAYFKKNPERFEFISKLAIYFAIANMAILKVWLELIFGKRYEKWKPTKR